MQWRKAGNVLFTPLLYWGPLSVTGRSGFEVIDHSSGRCRVQLLQDWIFAVVVINEDVLFAVGSQTNHIRVSAMENWPRVLVLLDVLVNLSAQHLLIRWTLVNHFPFYTNVICFSSLAGLASKVLVILSKSTEGIFPVFLCYAPRDWPWRGRRPSHWCISECIWCLRHILPFSAEVTAGVEKHSLWSSFHMLCRRLWSVSLTTFYPGTSSWTSPVTSNQQVALSLCCCIAPPSQSTTDQLA